MKRTLAVLAILLVVPSAEARVAKGDGPTTIVAGYGSVWVGAGDGTVTRIDERTGRVLRRYHFGGYAFVYGMTVGFGSVWVTPDRSSVVRIDARTGRSAEIRRIDWTPGPVAAGRDAVWVGDYERNLVFRIDPSTNRVAASLRTRGRLWGLAAGPAGVWVVEVPGRGSATGPEGRRVLRRIDPRANRFDGRELQLGCDPNLAVGARVVWMVDTCSGRVRRLDPVGRGVDTGGYASGIAVGAGSVWVGRYSSVSRIDPRRLRVEATIPVRTAGLAVGRRGVWALDTGDGSRGWLRRIDPTTNRVAGKPIRVPATDSHS
jgi:streptogramin lyase